MFESIIFRKQRNPFGKYTVDVSLLIEALLFYQKVTIIVDDEMLRELSNRLGYESLLELIENKFLRVIYLNNSVAIQTTNTNTLFETYEPLIYEIEGLTIDEISKVIFTEQTGQRGKGLRISNRFNKNVDTISIDQGLINEVLHDFSDYAYIEKSVKEILRVFTPEYKPLDGINFLVNRNGNSLRVSSNIDFGVVNEIFHKRIAFDHSTLSPSILLSHIFNVRSDIDFCTIYESEIATNLLNSSIMSYKFSEIIEKRIRSEDSVNVFQEFTLENSKAIGNAFANGDRTTKELIELIERADKFKSWLKGVEPDANLLKEYYKEISSESWIDKLPVKITRWAFFTGIGVGIDLLGAGGIGTASGLLISAGEALILDKILKGWKPNQFVEKDMKDFVKIEHLTT